MQICWLGRLPFMTFSGRPLVGKNIALASLGGYSGPLDSTGVQAVSAPDMCLMNSPA